MRATSLSFAVVVSSFLALATAASRPALAGSDKCPDHYAAVESGGDLDGFLNSFDWKFGTSDAEEILVNGQRQPLDVSKISRAYGCQFKGNFPAENACPNGTTLTRGTDVRYLCHSNDPIPEEAGCPEGFVRIQDYEYEKSPAGKIGRYGFFCDSEKDQGQDGFNEDVCGDSGASPILNHVHYEQGSPLPMLGCVYLK